MTPRPNVVADLHVHTRASDGTLRLNEVPSLARQAGLAAVAITDHDLLHPDLGAPVERRAGLTLIRGIELKVEREDGTRFDLLGYAVDTTPELDRLIERVQSNRMERARRMRSCLEERLGFPLDIDIRPGIGRPHIARAVAAHPESSYGVQDVFDDLIGFDGPCYVRREVPPIDAGVAALRRACPVIAVAHPFRYEDVAGAVEVGRRVGALERWYPYDAPVDDSRVGRAIETAEILPTGGSDAHGTNLGVTGLHREAYEQFLAACGIDESTY